MTKHIINWETPPMKIQSEVKQSPVQFSVRRNGKKLGTLEISSVRMVWIPAGQKESTDISWTAFVDFMEIYRPLTTVLPWKTDWADLATKAKKKRKTRKPRKSD